MQVSGKYDNPTTVIVEQYPVSIEQEAGWAPQMVWTIWRRDNLFPLPSFEFRILQSVT